jgi:enoyl-CoA hydratase/carnithine racemase
MGEFVRVERDGAIATIRLDRPPMNALSTQVQDEIAAAAGEAGRTPRSVPWWCTAAASNSPCAPTSG